MDEQLVQITRIKQPEKIDPLEINLDNVSSPVLRRLIEEVKSEEWEGPTPYNRWHNRHNRSR